MHALFKKHGRQLLFLLAVLGAAVAYHYAPPAATEKIGCRVFGSCPLRLEQYKLSIPTRIKTVGCVSVNGMPDPACTPGDVFASTTISEICVKGYSSRVRDVSTATKQEVYRRYGIMHHATGEYEVDHLIPLELGGSNDIANLFPQSANPKPGFHEKDQVENYLRDQACNGSMKLSQVQAAIANDWKIFWPIRYSGFGF